MVESSRSRSTDGALATGYQVALISGSQVALSGSRPFNEGRVALSRMGLAGQTP